MTQKKGEIIMHHEIIVVGAGPAGCSAAIYAKSRGKDVLILEKEKVGGIIGRVSLVSHYVSCITDETGKEFAERMKKQLDDSDIPVEIATVTSVKKTEENFIIETEEKSYTADKVVVAAGTTLKELPLETDADIYHWPCGMEEQLKNKIVIMNGGSDGASKETLYIAKYADEVHIVQDQESLMCIHQFREQIEASPKIKAHCGTTLSEIEQKEGKIVSVKLSSGEVISAPDGKEILVFCQIGLNPNTSILPEEVSLENGYVSEDIASTQIPGLYFAGDLRAKAVRQVATAVSDGCIAGINVSK